MPFCPGTWTSPAYPLSPIVVRFAKGEILAQGQTAFRNLLKGPPFAQIAPYISNKRLDEPVWVTVRGRIKIEGTGNSRHGSVEVTQFALGTQHLGSILLLLLMGPSGRRVAPVAGAGGGRRGPGRGGSALDHDPMIEGREAGATVAGGSRSWPGRSASGRRKGSAPATDSRAPSDCPRSSREAEGGDRWRPSPDRGRPGAPRRRVRRLAEIDQGRAREHDEEPLEVDRPLAEAAPGPRPALAGTPGSTAARPGAAMGRRRAERPRDSPPARARVDR